MSTSLSKEEIKRLFNERFNQCLGQGLSKNEAAAEALKYAQSLTAAAPSAPSPPTFSIPVNSVSSINEHVNINAIAVTAKELKPLPPPPTPKISLALVQTMVCECQEKKSFTPLIRLIGEVFSSAEQLSVCFCQSVESRNDSKVVAMECDEVNQSPANSSCDMEVATPKRHPEFTTNCCDIDLDIEALGKVYELFLNCGSEGVMNSLLHALESLAYGMVATSSMQSSNKNILKQYFITLEHPRMLQGEYIQILKNVVVAMDKLRIDARFSIIQFIGSLNEERYIRYITILSRHTTNRVEIGAYDEARSSVRILALFYAESAKFSDLSRALFYNEALCENYISRNEVRKREYKLWKKDLESVASSKRSSGHIDGSQLMLESFISFPFCLTPAVKALVLEHDATEQMRQGIHQEYEEAVAAGSTYIIPYFVLRVRRAHLVEDTINHFVGISDNNFKKPLKVIFDGEEGVDMGGVRKEFYQVMMKQLLDPNFGMFKYYPSSRLLWFNSDSLESSAEFELIGILLGVAIYNSIIVEFSMPKVVYKKLKGKPCNLEDLDELQPDLAHGLKALLEFDGDVKEVFQTTFQITYEIFGELRTIDLIENGGQVFVDNNNRAEYVRLYTTYLLDKSVEQQFNAFATGFKKVCGGDALDLFQPDELELLICGNPTLDFTALEANTRYEDGFTSDSPTIKLFWEVLHSFTDEEKHLFLKFMSGSDRAPIGGLGKMDFIISRIGGDDYRLPSAHTCFNHMLLPEYTSKEVLSEKLRYAINHTEGFGLR